MSSISDRVFHVHPGLHVILFLYLNNTYEGSRREITDEVTSIEALIGRTIIVVVL